jgi:aminopeptidase YwaD
MKYLLIFFPVLLFLSLTVNDKESKRIEKALSLIDTTDLMQTVRILSSDSLQGRLPGSNGYNSAAIYAANKFSELLPFEPDGYFQKFNVEYNEIKGPVEFVVFDGGKTKHELILGQDYVCRGFTGSGKIYAPVVFCGYGLSYPEMGYNDYASVDVKGKIVLIFKQNPSWKIPRFEWPAFSIRSKAKTAFEHGAVAVLFVPLPNTPNPQKPIGSMMDGEGEQMLSVPQLQISVQTADLLLNSNLLNISKIQTQIDSSEIPKSIELTSTAFVEVHTNYFKEIPTMNIIGKIKGQDLKDEYIIIGAHIDHVGSQAGKIIFPGANDNASGSSAVIQIAQAYMKAKIKPKRSIIFALFACEEHNLDGAKYLAEHLNIPLDKIIAMINLDCIAFGDSIQVGGGKSASLLYNIVKEMDSKYSKLLTTKTWYGGGADAQPFFDKGIPTLYFASLNSYTHLHLLSDKPETLNKELFRKITQLAFLTSLEIANGKYQREEIKKQE